MAFRQFLLKVHGRCNLACDHCYVYTLADTSWTSRTSAMTPSTVETAARRIGEHARRHGLSDVRVVLHGGEPLLLGPVRLGATATALRAALEPACRVHLSVQTNGLLLDRRILDVCTAHRIRVGVSVDGDRAANDRHRRHRDGRSSFDGLVRALELLGSADYRPVYGGLLCTVDVANDPIATYEALAGFRPPAMDFLLPNANWSNPPPAAGPGTPYGDWLVEVFDRWWSAPRREVGIRLFEEMLALLLGGRSRSEALGLTPADLVVVETDGAIEQSDALKGAYDGAASTGLSVHRDPFDAALGHPAVLAGRRDAEHLPGACRSCPVVRVCGGGLQAHRYREGTGFDNPSVFCADLQRVIGHVRTRLETDLRRLVGQAS